MDETLLRPGETGDTALGGSVRVIQPAKGYRFSLDAVLLARFLSEEPGQTLVDLGCGSGVVGLCALALSGAHRVIGVDIQPEFVDRARRSARWNGWEGVAEFHAADLRDLSALGKKGSVDRVAANPPYRSVSEGRVSSDPSAAVARHEVSADVEQAARAAAYLLRDKGTFCAVYPARRLPKLLTACESVGLSPEALRMLHPRAGEPATLALVRARKGKVTGLEVTSPLYLHGERGAEEKYSAQARRLLGPP